MSTMDLLPLDILSIIICILEYPVDFFIISKKYNLCISYLDRQVQNIIYIKHTINCVKICKWLLKTQLKTYYRSYYTPPGLEFTSMEVNYIYDDIYFHMKQLAKNNKFKIDKQISWYDIIKFSYFEIISTNRHSRSRLYDDKCKDNARWCINKIIQIIYESPDNFDISGKRKYSFGDEYELEGNQIAVYVAKFILEVINRFFYYVNSRRIVELKYIEYHKYCHNCDLWYYNRCELCDYPGDEFYPELNDYNCNCIEKNIRQQSAIITVYIKNI